MHGVDQHRRAQRHELRIGGERVAGGQRYVQRAQRPGGRVAQRQLAEEHVAGVLVEQRRQPRRVGACPGLDALHRGLLEGQLATLDQHAADRAVRVAVGVGIADAHLRAIGKLHPARALDLQEESLDRVVDPQQFVAGQAAAPQLAARRIRDHALAAGCVDQLAANALAGQLGMQALQIDDQQVVGAAVQRHREARAALPAAHQQRLVVTGDAAAVGHRQHARRRAVAAVVLARFGAQRP